MSRNCSSPLTGGIAITTYYTVINKHRTHLTELECGRMPNVMAALPHIGGALCSTPQSLADADY